MSSVPFRPDQPVCDACKACRDRCTSGILLTREEYLDIRAYIEALPPEAAARALADPAPKPWPGASEGETYLPCRFQDAESGLCGIYAVRPLVCRLFGYVEWLPCPIGAAPDRYAEGVEMMQARLEEEQRTWEEWQAAERAALSSGPPHLFSS